MNRRRATALGAVALVVVAWAPSVSGAVSSRSSSRAVTPAAVVAAINAVRATFHLPPGAVTTRDQALVAVAASHTTDPLIGVAPPGVVYEDGLFGEYSAAKGAALIPAAVVHDWVYDDGWLGASTINPGCSGPKAPGCNGHRRAVLSTSPQPGAKLTFAAAASTTTRDGYPTLEIAVIVFWSAKTS